MSILYINTGTGPNSGNGDSHRAAYTKINHNFAELYTSLSTSTVNTLTNQLTNNGNTFVLTTSGELLLNGIAISTTTNVATPGSTSTLINGTATFALSNTGAVTFADNSTQYTAWTGILSALSNQNASAALSDNGDFTIGTTSTTGPVSAISLVSGGSGYHIPNVETATTGGTGIGLTVRYTARRPGGLGIGIVTIVNPGTGYSVGDVITIDGGYGGTILVTNVSVILRGNLYAGGAGYFGPTNSFVGLTNPLAVFTNYVDSYTQVQIQNQSAGTNASSDFIATSDIGTDGSNYIDLGINNSGFSTSSWTVSGANDGYLYVDLGSLTLGTSHPNSSVAVHVGGTLAENIVATFSSSTVNLKTSLTFTDNTVQTTAWTGQGIIKQSSVAPTGTTSTLWYDTISGRSYVYYNNAWTDANPVSALNLLAVAQDIIPAADSTYNLGSSTAQWKSLYVSTNTIYINNIPISVDTVTNTLQVGGANTTTVVNVATENFVYSILSTATASSLINGLYSFSVNSDGSMTVAGANGVNGGTDISSGQAINIKTGAGDVWSFDNYGNLRFPDNSLQVTAYRGPANQTSFATESYVTTQGYTTTATVTDLIANTLTTYATQNYVITQGFLTSSTVNQYVTSGISTATVNGLIASSLTNVIKNIVAGTGTFVSVLGNTATIWVTTASTFNTSTLVAQAVTAQSVGTLTNLIINGQITTPAGSNANLVLNPDGLADVVVTTATQILMWATNTSISTTTGALVVTGGVGVGGTVTANKFVGDGSSLTNVTVTQQANIVGVQPNVTLVAGNYSYLFDNTGTFTMPVNGDIVMTGGGSILSVDGTTLLGGYSQVAGYYSSLGIKYAGSSTQYGLTLQPAADNTNAITFLNAAGTNIGAITQTTSTIKFVGDGSGLTNLTGVATKTTGNWTLTTGANTVNFSVPGPGTYTLWVNGNIPNGIVTYTANVVVTNQNVPVLGTSYGWYYAAGNALVLTAIPNQIVGTANNISSSVVATTTAWTFTFGITNNSGSSQTVSYGYTKLG